MVRDRVEPWHEEHAHGMNMHEEHAHPEVKERINKSFTGFFCFWLICHIAAYNWTVLEILPYDNYLFEYTMFVNHSLFDGGWSLLILR